MDKIKKQEEKNEEEDQREQEEEIIETENKEQKKLKELEEKIADFEVKWKRAVADYQNQEKWIREQRAEWIRSANQDLLLRILPVLDTLMLAQQHSADKNLTVSIGQFLDVLKGEGVEKIETVGKVFDPFLMEAVMTEAGEENVIIKELRAGYKLYEKVLRPAQVTVGNGNS